jgi:hypothetical protein
LDSMTTIIPVNGQTTNKLVKELRHGLTVVCIQEASLTA